MQKSYLGIDISKATFNVCLTHLENKWSGEFPNTQSEFKQLRKWLKKRVKVEMHCCMEATGRYYEELALYLHQQSFEVSVVNPKIIHHYAQVQMNRNKTDKLDADLINRYVEKESPRLWEPPLEEVIILRALTRHLSALQDSKTAESNRLQAGTHPPQVKASIEVMIATLTEQIEKIKREIQDHIDHHPNLKEDQELIATITGIAERSASKILSEIPNIQNFDSAKQLAAYAGLTPQQLQSGPILKQKGILKMGSKHLRTAFYMPALSAKQHNKLVVPLVQRLEKDGKHNMTIIAAVMRKLLHQVFGILKHRQSFDPNYLVNLQNTT